MSLEMVRVIYMEPVSDLYEIFLTVIFVQPLGVVQFGSTQKVSTVNTHEVFDRFYIK